MADTQTKATTRHHDVEEAQQKRRRAQLDQERWKALTSEPSPFPTVLETAMGEASVERPTDLLGVQEIDAIVGLQRTYGNRYVQRLAERSTEATLDKDIIHRIETHRGSGKALEPEVRSQMEAIFRHDLGQVRLHTDAEADRLSRKLKAKAFTTGTDIFFKEGTCQPNTDTGRRLIAHELTHVAQQLGVRESPSKTAGAQIHDAFIEGVQSVRRPLARENGLSLAPMLRRGSPGIEIYRQEEGESKTSSAEEEYFTEESGQPGFTPAPGEAVGEKGESKNVPRLLSDPKAQEKDPTLVADTPAGVRWVEIVFANTLKLEVAPYTKIEPGTRIGTKLGTYTFIGSDIPKNIYYKSKNRAHKLPLKKFLWIFIKVDPFVEPAYEMTKGWIPIIEYGMLGVMVFLAPPTAFDVLGKLIQGDEIIGKEAAKEYLATAVFAPLSNIKGAPDIGRVTKIVVDKVLQPAAEEAFKQLANEGKLDARKFTEAYLIRVISGLVAKRLVGLAESDKRLLRLAEDQLKAIREGAVGAATEVGKGVVEGTKTAVKSL